MQSKAKTVAEYMKQLPEERRAALRRLRTLCRKIFRGHREYMSYGMPGYGTMEDGPGVAFASQKNFIGLYITKADVMQKHRASLKGLSVGKSCIRYPSVAKMDFRVIEKLLKDSLKSKSRPCE